MEKDRTRNEIPIGGKFEISFPNKQVLYFKFYCKIYTFTIFLDF